ncbi:hypothetical protein JXA80_08200, partial [bacterium]|nr:hypothetical protein [candidate division CSSED10-310 bacterium]
MKTRMSSSICPALLVGPFIAVCLMTAVLGTGSLTGCAQAPDADTETGTHTRRNIVRNGDMEQPGDNAPVDWEAFSFGGSPAGAHAYDFDPGTRSHSISVSLDSPGAAGWRQPITLEPDSHWMMSCRVKTEDVKGRGLGATLFFPVFRYMKPPSTASAAEWTWISSELVNAGFTEMDLTCTLGAYGGNTGRAWFDDVVIVKQMDPAHDPDLTEEMIWGPFAVRYQKERGYITSLRLTSSPVSESLEFLGSYPTLPHLDPKRDHFLGDLAVDVQRDGDWQRMTTADSSAHHVVSKLTDGLNIHHTFPNDPLSPEISTAWSWTGSHLALQITLTNRTPDPMTIGAVDLPLPWNTNYCLFNPHDKNSQRLLYTRRVAEHKHIGGVSSYVVVSPMDGSAPHLLV